MGGVRLWGCPLIGGVGLWGCPLIGGVRLWGCPLIGGVGLWEVSAYGRCLLPFGVCLQEVSISEDSTVLLIFLS